jgi:hypothetical protein
MTTTKIALALALIAGSASVASAQGFDPNPANRYPSYATPAGASPYLGVAPTGYRANSIASQNVAPRGALQTAPVSLQQGRISAPVAGQFGYASQQDEIGTDLRDRASSPYSGGVN